MLAHEYKLYSSVCGGSACVPEWVCRCQYSVWLADGWLFPEHSLVASGFATLTGLKESLGYFRRYLENVSACFSLCVSGGSF